MIDVSLVSYNLILVVVVVVVVVVVETDGWM